MKIYGDQNDWLVEIATTPQSFKFTKKKNHRIIFGRVLQFFFLSCISLIIRWRWFIFSLMTVLESAQDTPTNCRFRATNSIAQCFDTLDVFTFLLTVRARSLSLSLFELCFIENDVSNWSIWTRQSANAHVNQRQIQKYQCQQSN